MPIIVDGDPVKGFVRERKLLKMLIELTVASRSPMYRSYVEAISRATGLPLHVVKSSAPVREYLKRIVG